MERKHLNCWEFKDCGRELGGRNSVLLGVCPAALDERADGIHGGKNGGRCCWVVASAYISEGTFGCLTEDFDKCRECDFYRMVEEDTELLVVI